jgi:hypothetical protein
MASPLLHKKEQAEIPDVLYNLLGFLKEYTCRDLC